MTRLYLLAFFAGFAAVTAWAPLEWWPVGVFSYLILYFCLNKSNSKRQAFYIGLFFGLGLHSLGHATSFYGMLSNFKMTTFMIIVSLTMFIIYLSFNIALSSSLYKYLVNSKFEFLNILIFSAIITLSDYSRSVFFNGFTTLSYGYIFIGTWFDYLYAYLGVYGIGFFLFHYLLQFLIAFTDPALYI